MKFRKLSLVAVVLAAYSCLVTSVHVAEDGTAAPSGDQSASSTAESGAKSADEVAKELANPNNSLAKLTFRNQFRWYTGDLPGADDDSNYTLLFQPIFAFALDDTASGGNAVLFARPAIPLLFDQPTFDAGDLDFDGVSCMGDIGFDLAYGVTEKSGFL